MSDERVPTYAEIRAIERGEQPANAVTPKKADGKARFDAMNEALNAAKKEAADVPEEKLPNSLLGDLLQLGAGSEVAALTIGGISLLELTDSPFLATPVSNTLTITILDTARALWAFNGGAAGAAPLLSALAMERAADELPEEYSTPLRVKAGNLRGQWDASAIRALEQCGKSKAEIDTELLVRIKEIIAEMALL